MNHLLHIVNCILQHHCFCTWNITSWIVFSPAVNVSCKHIGVLFTSRIFEYKAVGIQNVVAIAPLQEDIQIPVFVGEVIAETTNMFRLSITDCRFIFVSNCTTIIQIFVFRIAWLSIGYVIRNTFFKSINLFPFSSVILKSSYL